ncbi:MAG: MarR family transcriptional regulator [Actinomycetota bacterium]
MATERTIATGAAGLADILFTVMPMVAKHVNSRLEAFGMTTNDYYALRSVEGPTPMKELAVCLDIDPSYVTVVADRLEELGLIERQPHPSDRRVKNLVLTAKGRRFKKTVQDKLWSGDHLFSSLTEDECDTLIDALRKAADCQE